MNFTKTTESDSKYNHLEKMSVNELLTNINNEDKTVPLAVEKALPQIELLINQVISKLKEAKLIVVEGTLYPLLSRLKNADLLQYTWKESKSGPPRKYYELTETGEDFLNSLQETWKELSNAVNQSTKKAKAQAAK